MKRIAALTMTSIITILTLASCSASATSPDPSPSSLKTANAAEALAPVQSSFKIDSEISIVSREDGSGTRGAFIELFGVEVKDADGSKKDMTTKEAVIADKTAVMMTNVANDPYAIGYVSLGSLNESVKALEIDGTVASAENVKNGKYAIQRPFNIAYKDGVSPLALDFVDFILSSEGQAVVEENGCVTINDSAPPFSGSMPFGKLVIAGSSSVTPVMEKLKEAYEALNPGAEIVIQESDSSTGMNSAMNGACDIGMASRALKEAELAELTEIPIALDGIAIIVNNENPLTGITAEQVKSVYTGETTNWSAMQ